MPQKKGPTYKDGDGNTLFGFSQTSLDKTNAKLNGVVIGLKILIFLFVLLLIILGATAVWLAQHDVITRLIYRY
ncbi:hypothetical protein HYX17_05405 [Candidatus Woesearchaeota archaeon]|nr:hypothetical protein [Candidatus Woesearchaeota archaeon]